jgi:hypothetical protein
LTIDGPQARNIYFSSNFQSANAILASFKARCRKTNPTNLSTIEFCKRALENVSLEALNVNGPKTWNTCFSWNFQHTNATSASLEGKSSLQSNSAKESDGAKRQKMFPWKHRPSTSPKPGTLAFLRISGISNTQMQFWPVWNLHATQKTQ